MSRQRRSAISARPRAAIAISAALVLVMAFAGTVLGHHTLPSASFACDGTVTWHVADWTTDNTGNQALAPDVEAWYSLDGGAYVKIGVFDFDLSNYLTGFGGAFNGGSATTVTIKANLQADTTWADGSTDSLGPWFSDITPRASCASDAPSSAPSDAPSSAPSDAPSSAPSTAPSSAPSTAPSEAASARPTGGVEAATATPRVTLPATSTGVTPSGPTGAGFPITLAVLIGLALWALLFAPEQVVSRLRRRRR